MSSASDSPENYPHGALPVGTRLGEFEVRRVIGIGGFGIVYLAFDHLLEREVAVKEYMPASLAGRTETMHVSLLSQSNADTFALGLRSFVNEAKLLAQFDHPSLVKVHRFWEANATAYMAMPLYRGRTVREVRQSMSSPPDEAWLRSVLEPILGALERLHGADVYHRDIAPDNILLEADGRPVLLDFGAARRVITDKSQKLTAILKPSYAPIEQYADSDAVRQGPWTDIYALGATMHYLLLGKPPPPAPARAVHDDSPRLARLPLAGCSPEFLQLIDWMLAPRPNERPQSVAEVRDVLEGRSLPPSGAGGVQAEEEEFDPDRTVIRPPSPSTRAVTRHEPPNGASAAADATRVQPTVQQPRTTPLSPPPQPQGARPSAPAFTQQPAAAAPAPKARPLASPPPPPVAEPSSGGRPWLLPLVGGIVIAGAIGAWWSLRSPSPAPAVPVAPPAPAASVPAAPAAVAEPAPASPPPPSPAPQTAPATLPTPAATEPAPAPAPEKVVVPAPPPPASTAPAKPAPVVRPAPAPKPAPAARTPAEPAPAIPDKRIPEAPRPAPPVAEPASKPAPVNVPASANPAPAPEPAPAPRSPVDRCPNFEPAKSACLAITCLRNEFRNHPVCVVVKQEQEDRKMREATR